MKFETKIAKLGIKEEVENIIANCECGEVTTARLVDLTKIRKWEIMEVIGNYLDTDLLDFDVKFKTFLKTYDITEDEVQYYYARGICEEGYEIAYTLESNKDIVLILE